MLRPSITESILRYLFPFIFFFACFNVLFAQTEDQQKSLLEYDSNSAYYQIMAENVSKLDSFILTPDLNQVIATLERIARVEHNEPLPQYYLAFAYSSISFREKDLDKIDEWCDRSETALVKVEQIGGITEDEILVIRALIQYARLQVDFMGRGMEASANAEKYLLKAYKINPNNPRVLAILGQHYLKIPAQVGGSREKFCHYASLAIEAYKQEQASFPKGVYPIVPHWGESDLLESANKFCPSILNAIKSQ